MQSCPTGVGCVMNEQEPIKIIIEDEEPALKADQGEATPRTVAKDTGRKTAVR